MATPMTAQDRFDHGVGPQPRAYQTADPRPETLTADCGCTFTGRFRSSRGCSVIWPKYEAGEITGRQLNAHMNSAEKRAKRQAAATAGKDA